jgi:hypothetical protein
MKTKEREQPAEEGMVPLQGLQDLLGQEWLHSRFTTSPDDISNLHVMVPFFIQQRLNRFLLQFGPCHCRQSQCPPEQFPCPQDIHAQNYEETDHQTAAENDGVISPGSIGSHSDLRHRNSPRKDPEQVRPQTLVEVPSRNCCKEDSCQLGRHGVEYVAPVNCL